MNVRQKKGCVDAEAKPSYAAIGITAVARAMIRLNNR